MENTEISWTDNTFNPWIGCTKVSEACKHCYAETLMDTRYGRVKWGKGKPRIRTSEGNWALPNAWNRKAKKTNSRTRVFCASLSDVFDAEVAQAWRDDLWTLVRATGNLDWQILTKRPENIPAMLPKDWGRGYPNVWLGTSVENQHYADLRIPLLTAVPAIVHFLSIEPMLGPIDFRSFSDIEWGIVGGESGHDARPMPKEWVISAQKQFKDRGIPLFFKQWGNFNELAKPVGKRASGHLLNGKTVREFPQFILKGRL